MAMEKEQQMTEVLSDQPPNDLVALDDTEIELFVHVTGTKPKVVLAVAEETLREALVRAGALSESADGHHVFLGECVEALTEAIEVEDGIDKHATVDIDLKLAILDLPRHRHVHIHKCRHIAVEVNFNGKGKKHKFAPNATVAVATDWARRKFHVDPALASEYVLQLCNSTVQPRSTEHLGDVVQGESCSLCFDLVKEMTPKG
jgi:hypothetical protein